MLFIDLGGGGYAYLAKIQVHTISINDVIKEFHFNLMQLTFLQLGIKSNFLELVQNK
jgi:hypothetical protein